MLIVDDDILVLKACARILRLMGYDTVTASSGHEAVELLDRTSFEVVVADILMPGMDGLELLRKVRERDLDVPVILMTGGPTLETAMAAVEYGAMSYLVKPVDARTLELAVRKAASLHELARVKREAIALAGGDSLLGDRAALEVRFARGLASLFMAFQPIVRWPSRDVFAYEALLRCDEPTLPNPGAFLDASERLDRLHDLGRAIRQRIASSMSRLPDGVLMFVNLSPTDLADESLYESSSPLTPLAGRVVLEITERASLDGVKDVPSRVSALRRLGFRIAIDDLGQGYAGLTSMSLLSPDVVKLDMSLVRGVESSTTQQKLIGSMTSLCRELGMLVVAEGIETEKERDMVVSLGCELLQGYLLGRPGPLA